MRIHLLAVGTRMPAWVNEGYKAYATRLPKQWLRLKEITPVKRGASSNMQTNKNKEGAAVISAIPNNARVIALEQTGKSWSSEDLSEHLNAWMSAGRDVALLVGGADGLSNACLERCDECWSLSAHTLPHALVRVVVAEQLYRAWSILQNHPYHRA